MQASGGLQVNRDAIRTRLQEIGNVAFRTFDEQVHVQDQVGGFAQTADDRLSDTNILHKMAVHHLYMEQRRARSLYRLERLS
jgi:hypothetical protein